METVKGFWRSLNTMQKTLLMVSVIAFTFAIWASFVFLGADYSGFGDWLQSWFK
jgi:hypothetical protein